MMIAELNDTGNIIVDGERVYSRAQISKYTMNFFLGGLLFGLILGSVLKTGDTYKDAIQCESGFKQDSVRVDTNSNGTHTVNLPDGKQLIVPIAGCAVLKGKD